MIKGNVRQSQEFGTLKVGLGEVEVIAINPSREEYKEILGMDLKEDSRADEYLGESKDGNTSLRVDVWVKSVKTGKKDKIVYFLENKKRENKDGTKKQYINNVGTCSWAADENDLPSWFAKREYRQSNGGEEELYKFLTSWLKLDYKDAETVLELPWKDLMKGKLTDLKSQIGGAYHQNFVALYTVKTVEKDGETKEYQSIYNKAFLPTYALKNFRLVDYDNPEVQEKLRKKKSSELKVHERFVVEVSNPEHGCRENFFLKDIQDYDPDKFLNSSDKVLEMDNPEY